MFNLDGSEGKMCGNGIRCVAKFLFDNGMVQGDTATVETLSGIKKLKVYKQDGLVSRVRVDMGKAELVFLPTEKSLHLRNQAIPIIPKRISCQTFLGCWLPSLQERGLD